MAFMRGENYVYLNNDSIVFYCKNMEGTMPLETFDELVAMRFAQLNKSVQKKVEKRALKKYYGHFGCDALAKKYKKPIVMDIVKKMLKGVKAVKGGKKRAR